MPHYADGTPAKIGDVVKGKGYNLKDADGALREIVGNVVGIIPDSGSCNIRVMTLEQQLVPFDLVKPDRAVEYVHNHGEPKQLLTPTLEYGQCDHFVKVG